MNQRRLTTSEEIHHYHASNAKKYKQNQEKVDNTVDDRCREILDLSNKNSKVQCLKLFNLPLQIWFIIHKLNEIIQSHKNNVNR